MYLLITVCYYFFLLSNVGKIEPKVSLWPITTDAGNQMNQSKLQANIRRKTRENGRERVTIGFHWMVG